MKNLRVYISGVSGIVGYGIIKNLRAAYPEIRIYGSALDEFNIGAHIVDEFQICPTTESDTYLPWLTSFLNENEIDFAIPGIDIDLHIWNANRDIFSRLNCVPVLNEKKLITATRDKYEFYLEVEKFNFAHTIPTHIDKSYNELCEIFGTNKLIAKPKIGFAKKGFFEIDSDSDFTLATGSNIENLIFQPNLASDGFEYTSSVFGDGRGDFSCIINLRRRLAPEGFTMYAEGFTSLVITDVIREYCRIFSPLGPTNFQFMAIENKFFLLEINPRFSSSTSMRRILGYNESKMVLDFYVDGKLPEQPIVKSGSVLRYIEDFYVHG